MNSSLDILRKTSTLSFREGEEILIYFTASYDAGSSLSSSWQLGNLYLTNERLIFVQVQKLIFQIPLEQIQQMSLVKRRWILGKRVVQLNIQWHNNRLRNVFIAVKSPQEWKKYIEKLTN